MPEDLATQWREYRKHCTFTDQRERNPKKVEDLNFRDWSEWYWDENLDHCEDKADWFEAISIYKGRPQKSAWSFYYGSGRNNRGIEMIIFILHEPIWLSNWDHKEPIEHKQK